MNGSLVYSDTAITSTDGVVSIGHHTDYLFVWNQSSSTDAIIKLNGKHEVAIPHSPASGARMYHKIPGDYTTLELITTSVTISAYAIG